MLKTGDVVNGKYRIRRLLGDGGMGTVYEAEHLDLHARVALKFLRSGFQKGSILAQRFLQEARIAANIHSPYVTRVTDVDISTQAGSFLVMEFLEGEPLQARLERTGSFSVDESIDIALQVLAGLEAAHKLNVVHRDLKPDNIFLANTEDGPHVKLLDFGIAKLRREEEAQVLTQPGSFMGTPEYMAPEQAFNAERATPQSDIFSVGVLLYKMLSGTVPAIGGDPTAIVGQHVTSKPLRLNRRNPHIPDALASVVHHAMTPDPLGRPATAAALRALLLPFARQLSRPGRVAAEPSGLRGASTVTAAGGTVPVPMITAPVVEPPRSPHLTGPATPAPRFPSNAETREVNAGNTQKVSTTVPPESGPPPATQGATPGYTGVAPRALPPTAKMQAVPQESAQAMAVTPTAPIPIPPEHRKRSLAWLWVTLLLLAAGGGAGGYFYHLQLNDIGPPPPLPTAPVKAQTSPTPVIGAVPSVPSSNKGSTSSPSQAAPRTAGDTAAAPSTPSTAAPSTPSTAAPQVPTAVPAGIPTTLPAGIPTTLPAGIPTTLPAGLPTAIPTAIPPAPPQQ